MTNNSNFLAISCAASAVLALLASGCTSLNYVMGSSHEIAAGPEFSVTPVDEKQCRLVIYWTATVAQREFLPVILAGDSNLGTLKPKGFVELYVDGHSKPVAVCANEPNSESADGFVQVGLIRVPVAPGEERYISYNLKGITGGFSRLNLVDKVKGREGALNTRSSSSGQVEKAVDQSLGAKLVVCWPKNHHSLIDSALLDVAINGNKLGTIGKEQYVEASLGPGRAIISVTIRNSVDGLDDDKKRTLEVTAEPGSPLFVAFDVKNAVLIESFHLRQLQPQEASEIVSHLTRSQSAQEEIKSR